MILASSGRRYLIVSMLVGLDLIATVHGGGVHGMIHLHLDSLSNLFAD